MEQTAPPIQGPASLSSSRSSTWHDTALFCEGSTNSRSLEQVETSPRSLSLGPFSFLRAGGRSLFFILTGSVLSCDDLYPQCNWGKDRVCLPTGYWFTPVVPILKSEAAEGLCSQNQLALHRNTVEIQGRGTEDSLIATHISTRGHG